MLLLEKFSFSIINNLGTPSFKLQINFGVLQIDRENSATGLTKQLLKKVLASTFLVHYNTFHSSKYVMFICQRQAQIQDSVGNREYVYFLFKKRKNYLGRIMSRIILLRIFYEEQEVSC